MTQPYVALGDSYSAGVGAGARRDLCFRSPRGYAPLLGAALRRGVDYQACEGAIVDSLRRTQLSALSATTEYVTLTIGGNDAGFASVISKAAAPWWLADGVAAIRQAQQVIRTQLIRTLPQLYADLKLAAPNARIVVGTYPRLFGTADCQPLTFFTETELAMLNATADLMADVIVEAARHAEIECVDVRSAFADHAICSPTPYVNGLMLPVDESFHPSPAGHRAYADEFSEALGVRVPEGMVGDLEQPPCPIENGVDERGPAPGFSLPRLDDAAALRKAAAAGLDPAAVRELGGRLRRFYDGGRPDRTMVPGQVAPQPSASEVEAAQELRALGDAAR